MRWHHRPALDGLRTLAVYGVLLYHCGVSAAVGGFIGVDLFFVLSGFLVTSVLLTELHRTGRIDVIGFYARRVRRLLPAALVVILATSALFVVVSSTAARVPWVGDARGALLYYANWRFIASENDYFGADTSASPFLHFWSLAIEEQFYLVLPVLLLALMAWRRRWRPALAVGLGTLLVLSLAMQLYWAQVDPTHAYYGTDARIYQLLAGALAALVFREQVLVHVGADPQPSSDGPSAGDRLRAVAAWLVLAGLVAAGSSLFDVSASVRGIVAAVASVLLVWALTDTWSHGLNRVFALKPIAYLGRISYGTYLWHWPLVLVGGIVLDADPWVLALLVGLLATGLAALSNEILELPIRRRSFLDANPRPTIAAGLTFSVVLAVGLSPWLLELDTKPQLPQARQAAVTGATSQEVPSGIDWAAHRDDIGVQVPLCTVADPTSCVAHTGKGQDPMKVLVVGDSHARQLAAPLRTLAQEKGFTLAVSATGGCSWQLGLDRVDEKGADGACPANRTELYDTLLEQMDPDLVVLSQRDRTSEGGWDDRIVGADGRTGADAVNRTTVEATLDRLAELEVPTVVVESMLRPGTAGITEPLDCLAAASDAAACAVPVPTDTPLVDAYYRADVAAHPLQASVNLNATLCPGWPVCAALDGDVPVWRDQTHYTTALLEKYREQIWAEITGTGLVPTH